MLKQALAQNGLIAILRGLHPQEAAAVGEVLYAAGFRVIEVPLNSPSPYESIRILRQTLPADCLIGAGTVLTPEQVEQVKAAGGQVIVMPHSDAKVLRAAKAAGLFLSPGVATPTEAFAALAEGADVLKMFPAEQMGPAVVKAWLAVLPMPWPACSWPLARLVLEICLRPAWVNWPSPPQRAAARSAQRPGPGRCAIPRPVSSRGWSGH